jgi:hypothetical protein
MMVTSTTGRWLPRFAGDLSNSGTESPGVSPTFTIAADPTALPARLRYA